eukprot:57134-Chlamydomonas_euryale.AAC.1
MRGSTTAAAVGTTAVDPTHFTTLHSHRIAHPCHQRPSIFSAPLQGGCTLARHRAWHRVERGGALVPPVPCVTLPLSMASLPIAEQRGLNGRIGQCKAQSTLNN